MARTHMWALVALMHCWAHLYSEGKSRLDKLFLEPLRPMWYDGQPYAACEAIFDTLYSYEPFWLEAVSKQ